MPFRAHYFAAAGYSKSFSGGFVGFQFVLLLLFLLALFFRAHKIPSLFIYSLMGIPAAGMPVAEVLTLVCESE
jgi:H+/gluconate symporter-like permease